MSIKRYATTRDGNEAKIVKDLRAVGAYVFSLDVPFDLLVAHQGRLFLLEVKNPEWIKGKSRFGWLTPVQKVRYEEFQGRKVKVHIVTNSQEAITAITD